MEVSFEQIALAAATLVVNLIAAVIGGTWAIARESKELSEKIDAAKLEMDRRIDSETDNSLKQFGETMTAVRQKITDMELWNRDNFVNSRTFETIVGDIRDAWRRLEDKIDRRFDTLDRKLSKMNGDSRES